MARRMPASLCSTRNHSLAAWSRYLSFGKVSRCFPRRTFNPLQIFPGSLAASHPPFASFLGVQSASVSPRMDNQQ
jgi:hypothetical protein